MECALKIMEMELELTKLQAEKEVAFSMPGEWGSAGGRGIISALKRAGQGSYRPPRLKARAMRMPTPPLYRGLAGAPATSSAGMVVIFVKFFAENCSENHSEIYAFPSLLAMARG